MLKMREISQRDEVKNTALLMTTVCMSVGVVIVVSMGVVFGLLIGASMLGVAVCLLRW